MEEAPREADQFDESIPEERLDLTGLTVVTIDPADARDFDDAISLEPLDQGGWRLGVHIADVAHFVRPRRQLTTRPAARNAASTCRPRAAHAAGGDLEQPGESSAGQGPLYPQRLLEFNAEGLRVDRVPRGGHPQQQAAELRAGRRVPGRPGRLGPASWGRKFTPALLGHMHALAMLLRKRRFPAGALELDMPEIKVDLDATGRVVGATRQANTESHQIIEEFMLAANEAVAQTLRDKGVPFLRRIHQSQDRQDQGPGQFVSEWVCGRAICGAASPCRSCWTSWWAGPSSGRCTSPCCGR